MSAPKDQLSDNPFPGIFPFSYANRTLFFARESEKRNLIRLITLSRGVLLYADSGTGKSSLVNSGLIPLAIEEGFQAERIRVQAIQGSEFIIDQISENIEGDPPFLPSIFSGNDQQRQVVLSVDAFVEKIKNPAKKVHPLLIFDQFEEWITLFEEGNATQSIETLKESQHQMMTAITDIINDPTLTVKTLITLREDYLAKLAPFFERCPNLPDHYLRLTALKSSQIEEVVRGPFKKFPGQFHPELKQDIATRIQSEFESLSLGSDIRLTEVQIICKSLFDSGIEENDLIRHFETSGGVKGILEQYLEKAMLSLDPERQEAAIALLSRMVTSVGTRNVVNGEDLVGRVAREDKIPQDLLSETLQDLEYKAKLVRKERRREVYYYEIASEFLVEWIGNKAREYKRLADKKMMAEERQRANEQAQIAQRFRRLSLSLGIVFIVAVGFGGYAWDQRDKATAARLVAESEWKRAEEQQMIAENRLKETLLAQQREAAATLHATAQTEIAAAQTEIAATQTEIAEQERLRAEKEAALAAEQGKIAKIKTQLANSRKLAIAANDLLEVDPEQSLLLALQAVSITNRTNIPSETKEALHQALQSSHLRLTLRDHHNFVTTTGFSPDGKTLASGSWDQTAKIWNAVTGKEIASLKGHEREVIDLDFSPDGLLLATGSGDETAKIWDIKNRKVLHTLKGHSGNVRAVAFQNKGKQLATGGEDTLVKLWDVLSGKEIRTFKGHTGAVVSLSFSADGNRLATASTDQSVKIWEVQTGKEIQTLKGHSGEVSGVRFSPDGQFIATASADQSATIWELESGKAIHTLKGHTKGVRGLAFSPNGAFLATAGWDKTAKIWDAASGEPLATLRGHSAGLTDIAFSPDGKRLATASWDKTLKVWAAASGEALPVLQGHTKKVTDLVFSPNGKEMATASGDQTAKIWDAKTGETRISLKGHQAEVTGIAFNPKGVRIATSSADKTARIWDTKTGKTIYTLKGHASEVSGITFSPDGKQIATSGWDKTVKLWDAASGKSLQTLSGHDEEVLGLAFSPDGQYIATASGDKTAKIWEVKTGKVQHTLKGHTSGVKALAFSPNGEQLATASWDKTARIWDVNTGKARLTLSGHSNVVTGVAFSRDGKQLGTTSRDHTTQLWDAVSGEKQFALKGHSGEVLGLAFSPDVKQLATASTDKTVRTYLLNIEDLLALAKMRVTRSLSAEECKKYLPSAKCLTNP